MPKRMKRALVAAAALATIGLGATALVQASAGSTEKEDATVTGAQAEKAKAAALRTTKGGTAQAVERDGERGARWEVEVTKPGGASVEIELDENMKVVAEEQDDDAGESEQDDATDGAEAG
jgi:hypothetical protein